MHYISIIPITWMCVLTSWNEQLINRLNSTIWMDCITKCFMFSLPMRQSFQFWFQFYNITSNIISWSKSINKINKFQNKCSKNENSIIVYKASNIIIFKFTIVSKTISVLEALILFPKTTSILQLQWNSFIHNYIPQIVPRLFANFIAKLL